MPYSPSVTPRQWPDLLLALGLVSDPAGLEPRRADLKMGSMADFLAGMDRMYGKC